MDTITCTIMITETNGTIHVSGKIPDDAANTIACALATRLLEAAAQIMNQVTGQNHTLQRSKQQ